jgi:hypothetical protein
MGVVSRRIVNGSPGRARTADLVINSTRVTLKFAQKVEESETLFLWPLFLVVETDLGPNLSEHNDGQIAP